MSAGAAEIMRAICLAVAHLHNMHIAHRDLKVCSTLTITVHSYSYTLLYTYMCYWLCIENVECNKFCLARTQFHAACLIIGCIMCALEYWLMRYILCFFFSLRICCTLTVVQWPNWSWQTLVLPRKLQGWVSALHATLPTTLVRPTPQYWSSLMPMIYVCLSCRGCILVYYIFSCCVVAGYFESWKIHH